MKIVFICVKGFPLGGGIEKYTEELGARLVQRGHEVVVYSSAVAGTKSGMHRGIRVKTLPVLDFRSAHKLSLAMFATFHQFFERGVDIVHFHAIGPSIFCGLPRLVGRTTVLQSHGHEWMRAKWGTLGKTFFRVSEFIAMNSANCLTAVSHGLVTYYEEKHKRPVRYIPTGVNSAVIERPDLIHEIGLVGNDYILFMARLVEEKGAHYLIDAFRQSGAKCKLVIAGDAMYEERYKALLRDKAGQDSRIIFAGFVTGKLQNELLSNALCYVLPSEIEGLPISLLEAMSFGRCCIASDIEPNVEALGGFGVHFRNRSVPSLVEALERVLMDSAFACQIGAAARERAANEYSWDAITERFEELYEDALKGA